MTIPVSYAEFRKYERTKASLADAVPKALHSLGWTFEPVNQYSFKGKRPGSIWSWGENFQIQIEDNGSIRMQSKCSFPLTLVSWGKNKRNVRKFFEALELTLRNEGHSSFP
jgi:hypothetical protein